MAHIVVALRSVRVTVRRMAPWGTQHMLVSVANLQYAARGLRRAPGVLALAVFCIAVGIGATATMSAVADVLLFRAPPHIDAADRVQRLRVRFVFPGGGPPQLIEMGVPLNDYLALREDRHRIGDVAAYATASLSLDRGSLASPVTAGFASASFFSLLGVRPALGHWFSESRPDGEGDPSQAILSGGLWRRRFGADAAIVGRTVQLGQGTYEIVGVAPSGFRGVDLLPVDVWLPLGAARRELFDQDDRAYHLQERFQLLVRLGSSGAAVPLSTEASAVLQDAYVARFGAKFGAAVAVSGESIIPARAGRWSRDATVALWLAGMAGLVLLVACANVAGLLLVRATRRGREIAIRLALGARRRDLVELLGWEGLLVAAGGGALGLLVAQWGATALQRVLLPGLDDLRAAHSWRVLALAALLSGATGLACGLVPVLQSLRGRIATGLTSGGPRGRPWATSLRTALLTGQIALATTLTAGAVLFLSSWRHLREIQAGITADDVLVLRASLEEHGYRAAEARAVYQRLTARVRALPGVRAASQALTAPFVSRIRWPGVTLPGVDAQLAGEPLLFDLNAVAPGFFSSTGTALLRGRDFEVGERGQVAIINARMASRFWPGRDPVGRCITVTGPGPAGRRPSAGVSDCSRIVAVVEDTRTAGLREPSPLQVYVPLEQWPTPPRVLVLRTAIAAASAVASVRRAIEEDGASLPYVDVRRLAEFLAPEERPWRLAASLFSLFGATALVLAAVGIYGAFSYAVTLRTHELGIRVALGADRADVVRLVTWDGGRIAAFGIALGLVGAVGLGRVMSVLLVETSPTSPALLLAVAAGVSGAVLFALIGPAIRAAALDAAAALRVESAA